MLRTILRKTRNFFADPSRYVRESGPTLRSLWWKAEHKVRYREIRSRRALLRDVPSAHLLPDIDPAIGGRVYDSKVARDLTRDAVSAAEEHLRVIDLKTARDENKGIKSYLIPLHKIFPISLDSSIHALARNPEIVRVVGKYLGYVPILTYVSLWYSPAEDAEIAPRGSQFFHLDNEDYRQIKLFVPLHDLRLEHGPTTYLDCTTSQELWHLNQREMSENNIRIDYAKVPVDKTVQTTAPKGSIIMLDTSMCLHCGGKCQKDRFLLVFQYLTPCAHTRKQLVGKIAPPQAGCKFALEWEEKLAHF